MRARTFVPHKTRGQPEKIVRVRSEQSPICGKLSYVSKKEAKAKAKLASRISGERIEAYHCPRGCHAYHLGHPPGTR